MISGICQACPYCIGKPAAVPPSSRAHYPLDFEDNGSDVLLVIQSPGVDEWEKCTPLCSTNPSSAGYRFVKALERTKKRREDFDITNVVQCYPGKPPAQPNNNKPRDNKVDQNAVACCTHWLDKLVSRKRYQKIVAFGIPACKAVSAYAHMSEIEIICIKHFNAGLSNDDLDDAIR